ncbi:MAG TPA: alanine racemase [Bacteroidales bacterium]|nr:alanine racemase [Bacteroidales bacterium]
MITVPALLLNEQICRRNIRNMAEKVKRNNVTLRPHFKTHQSHETGRWFREEGTQKITVSSFRMAQYFAEDGWNDILVAFPVNILEIDTINQLAKEIKLSLLVESADVVRFLQEHLESAVDVYIKVDAGLHRTGVSWDDHKTFNEILRSLENSSLTSFRGFLTHSGHSYRARSMNESASVHNESITRMISLKNKFLPEYPDLIISVGDTPTCSIMDDFSMVDEIRPGNYVFYDVTQSIIGSCTPDQIAVAMACPVVATHKERNEIVIYGGSVHFAKDSIVDTNGITIYGKVVRNSGNGWGEIIEGSYLKKLSQEHGIVYLPDEAINDYSPGDIIKILPVHSCTTANLMKGYLTVDGRKINMML